MYVLINNLYMYIAHEYQRWNVLLGFSGSVIFSLPRSTNGLIYSLMK